MPAIARVPVPATDVQHARAGTRGSTATSAGDKATRTASVDTSAVVRVAEGGVASTLVADVGNDDGRVCDSSRDTATARKTGVSADTRTVTLTWFVLPMCCIR